MDLELSGDPDPVLQRHPVLPDAAGFLSVLHQLGSAAAGKVHRHRQLRQAVQGPAILEGVQKHLHLSHRRHADQPCAGFRHRLYLDRVRILHGFIRALYFLPYLTTAAAMAWVWRWFYQPPPIGIINDVLGMIGIPQQPFIRSTDQALYSVMVTAIWAGLGFQIIIFMAGLRAIPTTFYEAARIDGLGEWAILRKITLPLLKPTTVFLVVFSSIGFLRIFDQVYNMTTNDPGGPLGSTKPLVLMIYQTAFNSYAMGYAAAQTVVLFTILLAVSLVQLWVLREKK
ncbi:Maltose transport system permease protein malF [Agrobacterium tumefaciens]|nr:Maltose transport system permease protein malF [Agrobacterium tumefaciens]